MVKGQWSMVNGQWSMVNYLQCKDVPPERLYDGLPERLYEFRRNVSTRVGRFLLMLIKRT
jgi:hypothetical protein